MELYTSYFLHLVDYLNFLICAILKKREFVKRNLSKCGQSVRISEIKSNQSNVESITDDCEPFQNDISALTSVHGVYFALGQGGDLHPGQNQPHLHSCFIQKSFIKPLPQIMQSHVTNIDQSNYSIWFPQSS